MTSEVAEKLFASSGRRLRKNSLQARGGAGLQGPQQARGPQHARCSRDGVEARFWLVGAEACGSDIRQVAALATEVIPASRIRFVSGHGFSRAVKGLA